MQLFTIGLWKLNNDGTRMTDPNDPTQYIPTYDIEDIVQFSRVWVRVFFLIVFHHFHCIINILIYYSFLLFHKRLDSIINQGVATAKQDLGTIG